MAFQYHYICFSNQDHKLYKCDLAQVFIDTIRTFQYQDRITFTCKVCGFLGESRAQVQIAKPLLCQTQPHVINFFLIFSFEPKLCQVSHHVSELHIEPRRRLEDRDMVIDYIESHGSQLAG